MLKYTELQTNRAFKIKFMVKYLLILFPFCSFGQSGISIVKIDFHGSRADGREIDLSLKDSTQSAIVKNGTVEFKIPLGQPILTRLTFRHAQHGQPYNWFEHTILYLQPGVLEVNINTDSLITAKMKGPLLSVDYNEKLYKPVAYDNADIQRYQATLGTFRKNLTGDTIQIKTKLAISIKKCFEVPQVYIHANPNSPLSLIAIDMLGKGDPMANLNINDIQKLYDSLSENIKNSEAGLQCAEKLQRIKDN